ncbi:hypothetical protein GCM10022378_11290 [Salinicoccus jeotgali]|uniref:Uncharacterized protein n=1 Tax=Salinicoccus jeotgali TaxID=381634 RepID=A0ABP7ER03_9STAP
MKFEIGDYVEISKRWTKPKRGVPVFEGQKDFYEWCEKHNDDDSMVEIKKLEKVTAKEKGVICGFRNNVKTDYTLSYEEGVDTGFGIAGEGIHQIDSKHIDVYLVATRMNCIRRVSKEDIQLIADSSKIKEEK